MTRPPTRRSSWLRILFSLALLAAVCASIDWKEETALLRHVAWGWVIAALIPHLVNRLISATKWKILLRAKGMTHSYGDLLSIIWVSNFFGHFLPSAVGGDSLRMWQVARRSTRAPEAVSTVFVERLTGVISLAGLAIVGGVWSWARWGEHVVVVALLAPSVALLVILGLLWTAPGERLFKWTLSHFHKLPGHAFLAKATEAVQSFRSYPGPVLQALAISGIIQLNRVLSVYCLARSLGITLFFGEALVVVPAALFIAMLPLSVGGLGLHEGAFIVFLGLVDVTRNAAFAISLLSRVVTLSSNLPGAVIFLVEGFGARRGRSSEAAKGPRPLRVLWVADKLGYGNRLHGLGHYYLHVIPALRGVEVVPVVLRGTNDAATAFADRGLQLRTLRGALYDPRFFLALRRLVRTERIDAIQVHGYRATALGRAVGWWTGIPVIVRQGDSVPVAPIAQWCDRLFATWTREAIAVSNTVRRFCVESRGIPADRVHVLPNAAAPRANGTPSLPLQVPSGARLVGSITRFHPVKGVPDLVDAMAEVIRVVPQAHLVLWGDGPQRELLQARAEALGIWAQVHLLGYQPDAAAHLERLDCFVLPSLNEGSPNALLEAMVASCPIVATRVGGVTELVQDGEHALLVAPGDPRGLARAITTLLNDRQLAARLGRAAGLASARFGMAAHTEALERIYRKAIQRQETLYGSAR